MTDTDAQARDPRGYLRAALAHIEEHALRRERVAWPELRAEALALARDARTTADTYPAILLVLRRLAERHSFFLTPTEARLLQRGQFRTTGLEAVFPDAIIVRVLAGSPAARAGLRASERIVSLNGVPCAAMAAPRFAAALRVAALTVAVARPGLHPNHQTMRQANLPRCDRLTGQGGGKRCLGEPTAASSS